MKNYIKVVLLTHAITLLSIVFNVQLLRVVFGFVYLTFIPGFVILKVLKFENKKIDMILLSVGLSIAFLMFIGLFMNALFPIFGFPRPLSLAPLTTVITSLTLSLIFIGCRKDLISREFGTAFRSKIFSIPLQAMFLFLIPLLGIIGALYNNVFILLIMIVIISILYGCGFSSRILPAKFHLLIIFVISLALIFHTSLISPYIMGEDIHFEVYVFRSTLIKGYWNPPAVHVGTDVARFSSVLSITVLPTIYALFLDAQIETIYKLIYVIIYSLVPLVLYRIYEEQVSKVVALLSIFFFMSNTNFFGIESITLMRQIIGELFLVLSIFVIVDKGMPRQKKQILFVILGAGLIVSHYALAYFYVFLAILSFIILKKWRSRDVLNATSVLLLFVMTFSWYLYVSDAPLIKLEDDLMRIRNNFLNDLYSPAARAQLATLSSPPSSIISIIHRAVFFVQNFFIAVGVLELIVKGKKTGFEAEYRLMSICAMFVLIMCLAIPNFAGVLLDLTRFYAITIIFLAPFFVVGGETVFNWMKKAMTPAVNKVFQKPSFLSRKGLALQMISIVLVASFLFGVGFVEHVTGSYPASFSLDKNQKRTSNYLDIKLYYYAEVLPEQDVFSTIWLSKYMNRTFIVDSGSYSGVLLSYGLILPSQIYPLFAYSPTEHDSYAYLTYLNVVDGIMPGGASNITEISPTLISSNKIYTNGASEIYSPPH